MYRVVLAALVLFVPASQAAELAIRAVVLQSARVSPHGVTLTRGQLRTVHTAVVGTRIVFTP